MVPLNEDLLDYSAAYLAAKRALEDYYSAMLRRDNRAALDCLALLSDSHEQLRDATQKLLRSRD